MEFDLQLYLKELEQLVNIDSGSYSPQGTAKIAEYFKQKYEELGYIVTLHPGSSSAGPCLEVHNDDSDRYDVLLLGHMDTVFPDGTAKERPFTIKAGRALGPGVSDMKSGLLSLYYALKAIHQEKLDEDISICILQNSDEEIGSVSSKELIEKLAAKSKLALVFEAGRENGDLVLQRKGTVRFEVKFKGVAAHAGVEPQKGANAIVEMAQCILELNKLNNYEIGTTINAGLVSGGTRVNIVPEYAACKFDVRFTGSEEMATVKDKIRYLAENPVNKKIEISVTEGSFRPPMVPSEKAMKLWELTENIGRQLGMELKWAAAGGCSDANFTSAVGVPTLDALGPVGGLDHSEKEYLEISNIEPNHQLLKKLIPQTAKMVI